MTKTVSSIVPLLFFQKNLPEWKKPSRLVSNHDVALV